MERALDDALDRWRRLPSASLADDITWLSEAITARRPGIAHDQLDAVFRRRRSADLGVLLAALPPMSSPQLPARLDRLFFWPRDPRITEELRRLLLADAPRADRHSLWRRILALVAWTGDVRAAQWLAEVLIDVNGTPPHLRSLIQRANAIITTLGGLATQPSRAPVPLKIQVVAQALPPRRGPTDDLVWADWLLANGDPRGELIILQSIEPRRREQRRRVGELIRHHARAWLGRLSPAFQPDGLVFERGFVVAGLLSGYRGLRDLTGAPEWSTVRALDLRELARHHCDPMWLPRFLTDSAMGSLTTLTNFPATEVGALARWKRPSKVEHLAVSGWVAKAEIEELRRGRVLPRLKTISLNGLPV